MSYFWVPTIVFSKVCFDSLPIARPSPPPKAHVTCLDTQGRALAKHMGIQHVQKVPSVLSSDLPSLWSNIFLNRSWSRQHGWPRFCLYNRRALRLASWCAPPLAAYSPRRSLGWAEILAGRRCRTATADFKPPRLRP